LKKIVLLILLVVGFHLLSQEEKYQSGVIILKDGRIIAMRGDYEINGNDVQFLDDRGERVYLSASKVDFQKTDRQNTIIRERSKDKHTIIDDGSLYSKIMRGKEDEAARQRKAGAPEKQNNLKSPTKKNHQNGVIHHIPKYEQRPSLKPGQYVEAMEDVVEDLRNMAPVSGGVFLTLLAIFALLGIISLITEIYLMIISYHDSVMWGLAITFFSLGSVFIPVLFLFFFGASNPMLAALINFGLALGRVVTLILYIILVFPGHRMRVFLFWSAPLWFGFIAGIALFAFMV